jgi:hypothetical protein
MIKRGFARTEYRPTSRKFGSLPNSLAAATIRESVVRGQYRVEQRSSTVHGCMAGDHPALPGTRLSLTSRSGNPNMQSTSNAQ